MIYETQRLIIRNLKLTDFIPFHKMNSNEKVMIYTDSPPKTYKEDQQDLQRLIDNYSKKENNFWVWAVERKEDSIFLGNVAIIPFKEGKDEVGFRFLEEFWNNGYGFEAMEGLLKYAKQQNHKILYAEVYVKNKASEHILKKVGFRFVNEHLCKERNLVDRLYKMEL